MYPRVALPYSASLCDSHEPSHFLGGAHDCGGYERFNCSNVRESSQ